VLGEGARTLAELLRGRGFSTGGASSSFLLRRASGIAQGFQFFDAEMPEPAPHEPPAVERDGLQTLEAAEAWLRMQDGQRYFLFLEVPGRAADAVVSRVVQALKNRNLYDGATIVFTAGRGGVDSGARLDETALRVPFVVKQPGRAGAGRHVAAAVQHVDILPTLLDLVRSPLPGGLRGRSLRPILDSNDGTVAEQPIYAESLEAAFRFGGEPVFAITSGGYRFQRGPGEDLSAIAGVELPPDATPPAMERMRALLDGLLQGKAIPSPADIRAADDTSYAAAGYLPGLRTLQPLTTPVDANEQSALTSAHRSAARLVASRQLPSAIAVLHGITRKRSDLATVHAQIASLLARTGRLTEAVDAFDLAGTLRPDDPNVAMGLASAELGARRLEEAKLQAEHAVMLAEKSDPRVRAAAREVALRVALAANEAEGALAHAAEAQRADPSRPLTPFARGRLAYDAGRYEEALTDLQEAATVLREQGSELAELHLYLGEVLVQLNRHADAEAEFREEVRAFPQNIRAYSSLATLYRASNRAQAAEQTIDDLVVAAPTPEGYAMAARLWMIVGERARAEALRADARRRFRRDAALANLR
ncbi:MAG: tetratricopeptide repeat protein, partial [Vicinamibacterales bacterium]